MDIRHCPSEILAYLESFWGRVKQQNTNKTAQSFEHADIPAEQAVRWTPTESGTGRAATGGKPFAGTAGRMRSMSAPAGMYKKDQKRYPSASIWSDLTKAKDNSSLASNLERLIPNTNTPQTSQRVLQQMFGNKNTLKSSEIHNFKELLGPIDTSILKGKLNNQFKYDYNSFELLPELKTYNKFKNAYNRFELLPDQKTYNKFNSSDLLPDQKTSNRKKKVKKPVNIQRAVTPANTPLSLPKVRGLFDSVTKYGTYQDQDPDSIIPDNVKNYSANSMLDMRK